MAGLTYDVAGDDRLVLRATSVFPEFRKQGIATELIRRVLDDVRAQGKTVTIMCPVVRTFIEHNPEYADLIDPEHPGVTRVSPDRKCDDDDQFEAEAATREENNVALIAALDKIGLSEVRPAGSSMSSTMQSTADGSPPSALTRSASSRIGSFGCGRTSATSRPSTMSPPPSTRPKGPRARRSSGCIGTVEPLLRRGATLERDGQSPSSELADNIESLMIRAS